MKDLFFLCVSLSPTQEAKLREVQRSCFSLYLHPSSYALPPILPVACFQSLEDAQQEWRTNTLLKDWKPFVLSNLFRVGNILAAGPTPFLVEPSAFRTLSQDWGAITPKDPQDRSGLHHSSSPGDSPKPHSRGLAALPCLKGFYISEIDPLSPVVPFEAFPRIPVRVVRFQVIRIDSVDPRGDWWKGIEWTIEEEKWIKLA